MPDGMYQMGAEGGRPASQQHAVAAAETFAAVTAERKASAEEHEFAQAELDLSKEKDFIDIREAAEDQVLENRWYDWDSEKNQLIIYYTKETFPESKEYKAIEGLEEVLEQAGADIQEAKTEEAKEAVIDEVQTTYDEATEIWSLEEQGQIAQYTKELQAESTSDQEFSEPNAAEKDSTTFAVESQQLEVNDIETNRLIADLYREYPDSASAPRPKEVEVYLKQLWEIKDQIEAREATISRLQENEIAERDVRMLTPDLQKFIAETERTLHDISSAKESVGAIPETPIDVTPEPSTFVLEESYRIDTDAKKPEETNEVLPEEQAAIKMQELKDLVFAKVDRVAHRTHVERAAVDQLMRKYEAADPSERESLGMNLEHFIEGLGKNSPDPERMRLIAEQLTTEIEIDHTEDEDLVMTARSMNESLLEIISERPQELNPVDQLIAEKEWQYRLSEMLANLERLKSDHSDQYLDTDVVVLEEPEEPEWAESRIPKVRRRKEITPEVLDEAVDKLPILVNTTSTSDQVTTPLQTDYKSMYGEKLGKQVQDSIEQQHKFEEQMHGPRFNPVLRPTDVETTDRKSETSTEDDESIDLAELLRQEGQESLEANNLGAPVGNLEKNSRKSARVETRESGKERAKISAKIKEIESAGFGMLDRWVGDATSPIEALSDEDFEEFEILVSLPKNEFLKHAAETYPNLNLKYEVFQEWALYLKDLKIFSDKNPWVKSTTKAVVEGYVRTHLIDS